MKKILIITFFVAVSVTAMYAQKKTFTRDYTYQASEDDSRNSARAQAVTQMRNILLREVGEFIHAEQTLITDNYTQEYSEKIEAITAGIVEMKTIDEQWDGSTYYIKAEMTVDPADVKRRIAEILDDKQKTKELEDSRKRILAAEAEVERLKKELAGSDGKNNQALRNAYQYQTGILASNEYITRGNIAESNGWRTEAIAEYEKAYGQMPKNEITYLFMAELYEKINEYSLSVNYYEKYLEEYLRKQVETNPDDINMLTAAAEGCFKMAYLYYKKNNDNSSNSHGYITESEEYYERAEQVCKKMVLDDPGNANVYIKLANVYLSSYNCYDGATYNNYYGSTYYYKANNKWNLSIKYYKKAIEIDPNNVDLHIKVAILYDKKSYNYDYINKAVEYYKKAIELDPNNNKNVEIYEKIGYIYENRLKKKKEAKKYYEKAEQLKNNK